MTARPSTTNDDPWKYAGLRISSAYWWYFGAVGVYVPFATLYFKELGFGGAQIGVLAALLSIGTALIGPFAAALADARDHHRVILRAALLGAALASLLLTQVSGFWPFFILTTLFAAGMAPVSSQLDGYTVTYGDRSGASFGRLRVWGSAGFTLMVLVVGRWMGDEVDRRMYIAAAIALALALLSTVRLPRMGHAHRHTGFGGFEAALRNRPLTLLMAVAFISALGTAIANNFLGIHLEAISGSARLVGPAFAIGAASELPVMLLAGLLMRRLHPFWLVAIALFIYAIRFAIYGAFENPVLVLALQSLHGVSYGLFLTATVTLAFRLAGPELASTAQALLTAMSFGFGSIVGSIIGGALLDSLGTSRLFQGASVLLLISLAVLMIGNRFRPLKPSRSDSGMSAR